MAQPALSQQLARQFLADPSIGSSFNSERCDLRCLRALLGAGFEIPLVVTHVDDPADADIIDQIKDLLETRVQPAVANDGGDIVYRGFREGVVYLNMQGACSGCPSSTATLKQGIESLLKHYVPEVTEVRAA
mgnify:CR=1 FL=1